MSPFLKPSELPVGTTIEVLTPNHHEELIKVDSSIYGIYWDPVQCEDCQGGVGESDDSADAKIKAYRIVSLPYSIVSDIAESTAIARGMHVDEVITEAIRKSAK